MSLLSASEYNKLALTLESLHDQLDQQSKNIYNKVDLAMCRADCIQERLDSENEANLHEGADILIKVRDRIKLAQEANTQWSQRHLGNIKATKEDLMKQLMELELIARSAKESRTSHLRDIDRKIDIAIKRVEEEFTKDTENEIKQLSAFKAKIFDDLREYEQVILNNRKEIQDEEAVLVKKTEQIVKDLQRKMGELKETRKKKKTNFLELLESIIVKIQDIQDDP